MSARDQLVERVALAMTGRSGGWTKQDREPVSPLGADSHASIMIDLVREVLDAAYPQITTVADREALSVGTVVRSAAGTIACRFDEERGVVFGMSLPFPWRTLQLPLTVLWAEDRS